MPKAKDLWYFDRFYDRGIDWYASFFKEAPAGAQAIGEVGMNYFPSREAAERIAHDLPDARILVTLRNPIERAVSSYLFLKRNGSVHGSFADAVRERPGILENGKYAHHLDTWDAAVGPDQVHVLLVDDLKVDPHSFTRDLYAAVGVDPGFVYANAEERVNEAAAPRSVWLSRAVKAAAITVRGLGGANLVGRVKHSPLTRLIYKPAVGASRHTLTSAEREELVDYYEEDVHALSRRLSRDLGHWLERKPEPDALVPER